MSKTARPEAYSEVQKGVGVRIKWAREICEPNQAAAAELLQVDPSTLNKIEAGTRAPSIFNVIAFANRFGLSTDYILRGQFTGQENQDLMLRLAAKYGRYLRGKDGQILDRDTSPATGKVSVQA